MRIKRRLRRTLAFWQSGDDDEGSQVLDATGLTFAWNNALLQLEYIASEDSAPDALCFTVKDAHGEFQNLTIPVGFRAAASCASTLQARLHEPLNRTATSTAIHAARALDVDAGASNVTAIIEGSKISLNGLHLESHCKRNTSLRVTIIELEVEDFDGFVVGARLSYNSPFEQHSAVTVDETVPGKIVLATSAASGEVAVSQLNKAFAHIEYHPPPDFTGLSRLHVAVSDTSEKIPRGLEVDLWLAILELNESPEIVESGPTVRAVGTSPGGFLSLRAVVRSMPTTEATSSVADEATLADQARNAPRFFRENHGGVNIHDDDRTLLTISIQVVWSAKTDSEDVRKRAIAADGSRVALSLEAGCVVASCGILHFAEHLGERRGRITGIVIIFLLSGTRNNLSKNRCARFVAIFSIGERCKSSYRRASRGSSRRLRKLLALSKRHREKRISLSRISYGCFDNRCDGFGRALRYKEIQYSCWSSNVLAIHLRW